MAEHQDLRILGGITRRWQHQPPEQQVGCRGARVLFFTSPVPAELALRLGTGLLREAMAIRGRMRLASYDRLFPS